MNKLRSYKYIWEEGALIQNSNEISTTDIVFFLNRINLPAASHDKAYWGHNGTPASCGVLERMVGGWHCVLGMLASLAPPFETSGQVMPGESSYEVCIFAIRAK